MKIISITGYTRCGKDTLANFIVDELKKDGYEIKILRFADVLKEIISKVLGITLEELEYMKNNDGEVIVGYNRYTVREFLIEFSKILKTFFGKEIFTKPIVAELLKYITDDNIVIIIPDLRFELEYDALFKFSNNYNIPYTSIRLESKLESCTKTEADQEVDNIPFIIKVVNEYGRDFSNGFINKIL